ncbi:MAG: radical SAM/SPASM domain-containing protein [Candidatus Omnitrophota bacterium]
MILPFIVKYMSLLRSAFHQKRLLNLLLVVYCYAAGKSKVSGLPFLLQLEPTNRCNLNCALCLTGLKKLKRPEADISFSQFSRIIDHLEGSLVYLVLYNLGESLLHPQIYDMIAYAKKKNIFVRLSTNGEFTRESDIPDIINCGLDELVVSLDFITADTYNKYKRSRSFQKVLDNIQALMKIRRSNCKPFINVQLLLVRENEGLIREFYDLAARLGADKALLKKARVNFPQVQPDKSILPRRQRYIRECYKDNYKRTGCCRPWFSTVVLSDCSVVPCCFDMQGAYRFGDTAASRFSRIWNNGTYTGFRSQALRDINGIALCKECSLSDYLDNFTR